MLARDIILMVCNAHVILVIIVVLQQAAQYTKFLWTQN